VSGTDGVLGGYRGAVGAHDLNARAFPSHSARLSLNENESSLLVVRLALGPPPRPVYAHTVAIGQVVLAEDISSHSEIPATSIRELPSVTASAHIRSMVTRPVR